MLHIAHLILCLHWVLKATDTVTDTCEARTVDLHHDPDQPIDPEIVICRLIIIFTLFLFIIIWYHNKNINKSMIYIYATILLISEKTPQPRRWKQWWWQTHSDHHMLLLFSHTLSETISPSDLHRVYPGQTDPTPPRKRTH